MFHYDRDVIKLGKQRVYVLAVIGLAVESFLALAYHSRRGFNVLRWFNVKSVTFRNCNVNGVDKAAAEVEVDRTMAERALRIARAIAERAPAQDHLSRQALQAINFRALSVRRIPKVHLPIQQNREVKRPPRTQALLQNLG